MKKFNKKLALSKTTLKHFALSSIVGGNEAIATGKDLLGRDSIYFDANSKNFADTMKSKIDGNDSLR